MYQYKAAFISNYDGDTTVLRLQLGFDISLEKSVRLLGVDTPELKTGNNKDKAKLAKDWLKQKLDGKKLVVTTCLYNDDGGLDKYGRILGEIFIVGETISVNDQLIAAGHAVAYDGGKKNLNAFDAIQNIDVTTIGVVK